MSRSTPPEQTKQVLLLFEQAVGLDPENNQVKTALNTAQQAVAAAKVADAKQAAGDAANKAAADAAKGLLGGTR